MAKTFKNLPQSDTPTLTKRASERDFFDLTDDPQPVKNAEAVAVAEPVPAAGVEADNTDNNHHSDNSDNSGNTVNTSHNTKKRRAGGGSGSGRSSESGNTRIINNSGNIPPTNPLNNPVSSEQAGSVADDRDVRQTFVLSQGHLERLRDHVHARRISGDYNYSQKQALQQALDLLFASTTPVSPRPEQVRELEQQRRERIQAGRLSRT